MLIATAATMQAYANVTIENIGFSNDKTRFVFKIINDSDRAIIYRIFTQTKTPDSAAIQQYREGDWQGFYGCGTRSDEELALYSDFSLASRQSQLTSVFSPSFKSGDKVRMELGFRDGSDIRHIYSPVFTVK